MHRPSFPYKFKVKCSGCPNDCVASVARADLSVIGVWKDDIRIDQAAVAAYQAGELKPRGGSPYAKLDVKADVTDLCPTACMKFDGKKLAIDNKNCNHCMHCISLMPQPCGSARGPAPPCSWASMPPILEGAQMSWSSCLYADGSPYDEIKELIAIFTSGGRKPAKNRERVGELMLRLGMRAFFKGVGLEPPAQTVRTPTANPSSSGMRKISRPRLRAASTSNCKRSPLGHCLPNAEIA